ERRRARRGRARGPRLPALPAPGGLARGGRPRQAGRLRAGGVLGPARRRLRRSGRPAAHLRPRPRRPRRQPHGPVLHGGPLRRVPHGRAAPRGLREPAALGPGRRRPQAHGRLHHRRGAVRAAGQPAHAGRARRLPAVGRARARRAGPRPRRPLPRGVRLGRGAAPARGRERGARPAPAPALRPRRGVRPAARRAVAAARLLPPLPAEHVHRAPDPGHARRRARPGAGARGHV
ncbi:MAG: Uracil-DNA glycosylase, family 5, partial [uncultured Solirubrobacteraceae bacterium]